MGIYRESYFNIVIEENDVRGKLLFNTNSSALAWINNEIYNTFHNKNIEDISKLNDNLLKLGYVVEGNDLEYYFPLLMVKDFGSKQFAVSDEYMTNADTPYIATKDVIDNPVNPFTGNVISDDAKDNPVQYVFESDLWETGDNDGNVFNPGRWYMVYTEDIWNQYGWNIAAEDATLPVQN